jgi:cytochrome c oxidase cbb3-type subunit 3
MKNFAKNWIYILIVAALGNTSNAVAQEGEQLFKSRCNTCHQIDKNSTGPKLKGVKQKWADAGEGENLYAWISNSTALIASGKSQLAKDISGYSPTAMPAQTVTNAEVDAIFEYVETYTPPAAVSATPSDTSGVATSVVKVDYKYNLTVFNWLLFLTVILVVVIIVLSGSIIVFVKSDYFKQKVAEKSNTTMIAIILTVGALFSSFNASALTFIRAGEGEKDGPWLLVENMDLIGLLTINIILMFVVIYLRGLFNQMVAMTKKEAELAAEQPVVAETFTKINAILTDAVPIEEEYKILMDHEYDGIQELDNNLPPWWVWGFVACIIFAFVYIINYHVLGTSDLQIKAYEKEMEQAQKDIDAYLSKMAMNVDETNATLMTEKSDLEAGKTIFDNNCTICHKSKGEGDVGPNLTDKNWVYGYDVKDVFLSVKKGRPAGMPEHASKLNPVQIQQVASYVLSLPSVKGKEPQGDIIEK